jgi:hypothetical protein
MFWFELISFIVFVILMMVGYRKNKRNWMLCASLILLVGLAGTDFIEGVQAGGQAAYDKAKSE